MRTLRVCSLSNFQIYDTVLVTIISVLCITACDLFILYLEVCTFSLFRLFLPPSPTLPLATTSLLSGNTQFLQEERITSHLKSAVCTSHSGKHGSKPASSACALGASESARFIKSLSCLESRASDFSFLTYGNGNEKGILVINLSGIWLGGFREMWWLKNIVWEDCRRTWVLCVGAEPSP